MRPPWLSLLLLLPAGFAAHAVESLSVVTYNVHGNSVEDWSTNSPQVQAIGRQMSYLNPDIITFQEIPFTNTWQMPNFVRAFLPGYSLATNSGTDGYIRSVILSRYPITRSQKWLDGVTLVPFGYTNSPATFTRDLFEAEISVPGYEQPVHVFTTHLKSGTATLDKQRRAAEASAISNFLVTVFLPANGTHPYVLTGDLNEDLLTNAVARLVSAPTGLRLTTPVNPVTTNAFTFSIQGSLNKRYDYILPAGLFYSNVLSSQVFRTDLLPNPPAPLQSGDNVTASDHLPVMMVFGSPYNTPFRLLSLSLSNQWCILRWESKPGRQYAVDAATSAGSWSRVASNLVASGTSLSFTSSVSGGWQFFRVYRTP